MQLDGDWLNSVFLLRDAITLVGSPFMYRLFAALLKSPAADALSVVDYCLV